MIRNAINPMEVFEQAIEEIYIQEQVNLIDRLCRDSDDPINTPLSSILNNQDRGLQRLRRDSILDLTNNQDLPVPVSQFQEEFGNSLSETFPSHSTGNIASVFTNILIHMYYVRL